MSDKTKIEWAANADGSPGASWNPIRARNRRTGEIGWFCTHASDGCRFCYAERFNRRLGTRVDYTAQGRSMVDIFLHADTLTQPMRWRRARTAFVCSMSDLFGEFVDDAAIDAVWAAMALSPQHVFIVVTKRARRMREYLQEEKSGARARIYDVCAEIGDGRSIGGGEWPLANVICMVSAESQREAEARIPDLLATPAAWRGVSLEPLLGPIDLARLRLDQNAWINALDGLTYYGPGAAPIGPRLDWVIVGGESGPDARPMHPDWARALRDQCAAAGAPFFFKQWGEWTPTLRRGVICVITRDGEMLTGKNVMQRQDDAHAEIMSRVGKRDAGRLLDGREWNERPAILQPRSTP